MTIKMGGPVGIFFDEVQRRQIPVVVLAKCEYSLRQPGAASTLLDPLVQMQVLRAIREVVACNMKSGKLTFLQLGSGDVAPVIPEIIAASGLPQRGFQLSNLLLSFGIDGHTPSPPSPRQEARPSRAYLGDRPARGAPVRVKPKVRVWALACSIVLLVALGLAGFGIHFRKSRAAPRAVLPPRGAARSATH
jgi:hypothetical protein